MANIRADFTNANIESGLKKLDVRDFIFQLEPEEAPFVTVLNKIRKESCRDIEFSWFEDIAVGKYTQINNGGTPYNSSDTTLVVDDADIFQIGDLVQCCVAAHPEILRVTGWTNATTIVVSRAFGTATAHADAVANDVYLYRIGQSMAEGYTVGDQLITTKTKVSNYVQIFSRPVQFTETANAISTFGGNRRNYERKKVGIELKKDIETQFLFGQPYYTATGPKYQTGGIKYFMSTTSPALNCAGALHKDDFDGWLKDAMHYGSSEKFLFASPLILAYINGFADTYLRTDPGQIKTWGVRFSTYTSPFGDINIVLNRNFVGPYAGEAVLLDMKELVYRYLEGLDLKLSTDLQPSNVHYLLDEYAGTIGLEIHSPLKHARIYGTT
jgi:hypothetical protein